MEVRYTRYTKRQKIFRWLKYGVIVSIVPFLLSVIYEWWAYANFQLLNPKYLPDFILVVFAVSACVRSNATDIERDFPESKKSFFAQCSLFTVMLCVAFYCITKAAKPAAEDRPTIVFGITCFCLLVNIILGCVLEGYEGPPSDKSNN